MQTLLAALTDWADMQAVVNGKVILVRDFACYQGGGIIVKVDGEEDGLNNPYYDASEIERDLTRVVPGYTKGSAVWQEGEYDY